MGSIALAGAVLVASVVWPQVERAITLKTGAAAVEVLSAKLSAFSRISAERGPTNGVLGSDLPIPAEREAALGSAREASDKAMQEASEALARAPASMDPQGIISDSLASARESLIKARGKVDELAARPKAERSNDDVRGAVDSMIAVIPRFTPGLNAVENTLARSDPGLVNLVTIARLATEMRDYAGQLGSIFTAPIVLARPLAPEELSRIDRLLGTIGAIDHLSRLALDRSGAPPELAAALAVIDREFTGSGLPMIHRMKEQGRTSGDYGITTADFAARYVPEMNVILELRARALAAIATRIDDISQQSGIAFLLSALISLGIMGAMAFTWRTVQRRISEPLGVVNQALQQLVAGERAVSIPNPRWNDEIADIFRILRTLQGIVLERDQKRQIAELESRVSLALQHADDLGALAYAFFSSLAAEMRIVRASLHRLAPDGSGLLLCGGYALPDASGSQRVIPRGEGLVGQCANSRRRILLETPALPEQSAASALAELPIACLLVMPVISGDDLSGVMELALTEVPGDGHMQLLEGLLPLLAMRIDIIKGESESRGVALSAQT